LETNEIFKSNNFRNKKGQSLAPFPKKTRYKEELVTVETLRSSSLCQSSSEWKWRAYPKRLCVQTAMVFRVGKW